MDDIRELTKQLHDLEYTLATKSMSSDQEMKVKKQIDKLAAKISELKELEQRQDPSRKVQKKPAEYLFLDFSARDYALENNKDWNFKITLEEQYAKLPFEIPYNDFINEYINREKVTVKFSFPNFDRKSLDDEDGKGSNKRWKNIAIRIVIPTGQYDLIVLCDMNKYTPKNKDFEIRKLEPKILTVIDKGALTQGEILKICDIYVCLDGVWKYPEGVGETRYIDGDLNDKSVLNDEFLRTLRASYVAEPHAKVIKDLERWRDYLDFRVNVTELDRQHFYELSEGTLAFVGYRRSEASAQPGNAIDFLETKKKGRWSSQPVRGYAVETPLLRISYDIPSKQYKQDSNLGKRFGIFCQYDHLILRKKRSDNDDDFKGALELDDCRISYDAGKEIIIDKDALSKVERARSSEEKEAEAKNGSNKNKDVDAHVESYRQSDDFENALERYRLEISESTYSGNEGELNEKLAEMKARLVEIDKSLSTSNKTKNKKKTEQTPELSKERDELLSEIDELQKDLDSKAKAVENKTRDYSAKLLAEERKKYADSVTASYDKKLQAMMGDISAKYEAKIKKIHEDGDIVRLHMFFELPVNDEENPRELVEDVNRMIAAGNRFLYMDTAREAAQIRRQREALDNLFCGNVMNPFLATALYHEISSGTIVEREDVSFFNPHLNDGQKKAVRKALSANGIFLIRGPPGTGKTEVIAEIVAQLALDKKKVLIASENHKAIDNAFDRLPKKPFLHKVRIFARSAKGKEASNEYSVGRLTQNLYNDVSDALKDQLDSIGSCKDKLDKLEKLIPDLSDRKKKLDKIAEDNSKLIKQIEDKKNEMDKLRQKMTKRLSENTGVDSEITILENKLNSVRNRDEYFEDLLDSIDLTYDGKEIDTALAYQLACIPAPDLRLMLNRVKKNDNLSKLAVSAWKNKDDGKSGKPLVLYSTDDPDYKKFIRLFPNGIPGFEMILNMKESIDDALEEYEYELEREIKEMRESRNDTSAIEYSLRALQRELDALEEQLAESGFSETRELLLSDINNALSEFSIPYNAADIQGAIELLEDQKNLLKIESKKKITKDVKDAYSKIVDYLHKESVIASDSETLNGELLSISNVIGLTCTTGTFAKTDVGTMDLREVNLDVVIVDEVSKTSFLELLYPILLGKTIILVGDDRQLNPTYQSPVNPKDSERYKEAGLDISRDKEFKNMYENSLFAKLYANIPDCYKTMLYTQYRMHPQIMEADNQFYEGKLESGCTDEQKQHYLHIKGKGGREIIGPRNHIIFVDTHGTEERSNATGTSRNNEREADVVVSLIRSINSTCNKDRRGRAIEKYTAHGKDERMSVGVICGYRDQKNLILDKINGQKFQSFNRNYEERFIVDTVDNFQGDERDIIILSLTAVRADTSFMKKFNRVNVAISRARRLLIIVGRASSFAELKVDIDSKTTFAYKKIIDITSRNGGYLNDTDVLGGDYREN